jgi:hypothetical protein
LAVWILYKSGADAGEDDPPRDKFSEGPAPAGYGWEANEMRQVIILSRDEDFLEQCEHKFMDGESDVYLETDFTLSTVNNLSRRSFDVAVIHLSSEDDAWFEALVNLRKVWPEIRIVLATDRADYWRDFRTWMADACVSITDEPFGTWETLLPDMEVHSLSGAYRESRELSDQGTVH